MNLATFQPKFFVSLVKLVYRYGSVFVLEDGNMYLKEEQAVSRVRSKEKLAHINGERVATLRYARVTKDNLPKDADMLDKLFAEQTASRRTAQQAKQTASVAPEMTDEEALAILNGGTEAQPAETPVSNATETPVDTETPVEAETEAQPAKKGRSRKQTE